MPVASSLSVANGWGDPPFSSRQSEILESFSEVSELIGLQYAHDLQISAAELTLRARL